MRVLMKRLFALAFGIAFAMGVSADEGLDEEALDRQVLTEGEIIASELKLEPDDARGLWHLVVKYEGEVYNCVIVTGESAGFDCHLVVWKP